MQLKFLVTVKRTNDISSNLSQQIALKGPWKIVHSLHTPFEIALHGFLNS